jgi:hypothetical protein
MNKFTLAFLISYFLGSISLFAQTANDHIKPYNQPFRPGVNLGFFQGLNNENLADLAAGNPQKSIQGIGAKSIRTGIFNEFVEVWGYDFLEETYDYFDARGLKENTVIIGFPAAWQRDQTFHCPDKQSTMFANLYEPIFDNGENGTPVNDQNYLALYLYKLVTQYKDHVRFWEIWNEPGSDMPTGFQMGWRGPGFPGNWWENNPDPCDNILHAPIYHYVRTLRVSYEVIKSIDPDAYVSVAGFGFPAFLDAVLRNTDNPVDGSPTAEYPLGGGAYFDVFGNHSYPHFDGSTTNFDEGRFERHSDRAADGVVTRRKEFEDVLAKYGYDGNTYPLKPSIITEINIPRKQFGDFIGGKEVQTNFIIKAFIKAKTNNVFVIHPYNMIERDEFESATSEFGVMGMYEKFNTPGQQVPTGEAIAYKTTSDLLYTTTYDQQETNRMALPAGVRGHAFKETNGNYIYALWAETTVDFSEDVSATYSFPSNLGYTELDLFQWNYSQNQSVSKIAATNIALNARPIFLRGTGSVTPPPPPPPPPPSGDKPNLSLTLSASNAEPGIYNTTALNLTLHNTGAVAATDVTVSLPLTAGQLAYTGQSNEVGSYFNWNGEWVIPKVEAGSSIDLTVNVFTLTDNTIDVFAQVLKQNEVDENSQPGNGVCCTAVEDDEAYIGLNNGGGCNCQPDNSGPVCGANGITYANSCAAICAGVVNFTTGACSSGGGNIDLELSLEASKSNFVIYETVTFSFVLKNTGQSTANNIIVGLKGQKDNLAYAGHTTTHDFSDWSGNWKIASLAPGEVATLNLGLFTLQDSQPHTIFAQVTEVGQSDVDSSPDNNGGVTPSEDDEAAVTVTPANNLNGNTLKFRNQEEKTFSMTVQQLTPNPASTELKARIFSKKEAVINLIVLNPQGQLLINKKEKVKAGLNFVEIEIDDLPSGIYFLQMEGTDGIRKPMKFIKQRL